MFVPSERIRAKLLPRRAHAAISARRASIADLQNAVAAEAGGPTHLWSGRLDRWRVLRRELASCDDASYAAARAWALEERARLSASARPFLAFVFDAEPSWAEDDLRASSTFPLGTTALALATARDPSLVRDVGRRLLDTQSQIVAELAPEVAHTLADRHELAAILLDWLGELERLRKVHAGTQHAWDFRGVPRSLTDVLAYVGVPEAAHFFASKLGTAEGRKHAARFAKRFPALAAEAVAPIAHGRGKTRDHAEALLRTLAPSLASSGDAVSASVRETVDLATHDPTADLPIAHDDDVPAILRDPPWRRWKSAGLPELEEPPAPELQLPPSAVSSSDRQAWVTKLPSVPRQTLFSSRAAFPIAHAWLQRRAERAAAEEWMHTFAPLALYGLISYALGPAGPSRLLATSALRGVWRELGDERGDQVATRWATDARLPAPEIVRSIHSVLAADPRFDCPARAPSWPSWLPRETLRAVCVRGGAARLPDLARDRLVEMLAFAAQAVGGGDLVREYAGVDDVREALDPDSLEDFSWSIAQAWSAQGGNARATWPLDQLVLFGRARTARELAAKVRADVTERSYERALDALQVLGRLRDDAALIQLARLATTSRAETVRERAKELLEDAARSRGVDADRIDDLLVPDLGLDERGELVLDFGSRTFRITIDERLQPLVHDESGARLPTFPRARKDDDPEKAAAATEAWRGLRDDAETASRELITRLERAMCNGRRWSPAELEARIVRHPLLVHLARRLVWATYEATNATRIAATANTATHTTPNAATDAPTDPMTTDASRTFRIAEDGSYASLDDAPFELPTNTLVGLPHPLELSMADREAWAVRLADYELLQPFPQLTREVLAFDDAERTSRFTDRFLGKAAEGPRFFALESRGWSRTTRGPEVFAYRKSIGPHVIELGLLDPFSPRAPQSNVRLGRLSIVDSKKTKLDRLTAVEASELLRDVAKLVE